MYVGCQGSTGTDTATAVLQRCGAENTGQLALQCRGVLLLQRQTSAVPLYFVKLG